jgi:8-oxo-dGTP pyrophosphatase MutT (NUDIX family)
VLPYGTENVKNRLKVALRTRLPGEKAHRLMLPQGRDLYPEPGKNSILESSVLMLIFPDRGEINTCLIKRPAAMRNHGGQISFPGGRYEPADEHLSRTALRESFEETGTDENEVEIIGALTPIYVQVSNFRISPFVGWSEAIPHFKIDRREVDELYIIPLENFVRDTTFQSRTVNTPHGTFDAPGFYIDNLFIWGATAMIISEFREIYLSTIDRQITG